MYPKHYVNMTTTCFGIKLLKRILLMHDLIFSR